MRGLVTEWANRGVGNERRYRPALVAPGGVSSIGPGVVAPSHPGDRSSTGMNDTESRTHDVRSANTWIHLRWPRKGHLPLGRRAPVASARSDPAVSWKKASSGSSASTWFSPSEATHLAPDRSTV